MESGVEPRRAQSKEKGDQDHEPEGDLGQDQDLCPPEA